MGSCLCILAAKIASDFSVRTFKPYAVEAQWIMSEKYKAIQTTIEVELIVRHRYLNTDSTTSHIENVSSLISK